MIADTLNNKNWNEKGRKTVVLNQYYQNIGAGACEKIESVALDGAKTYISSTKKYAINTMIVYDRFHLIQKLNNAVDTAHKEQLKLARKADNTQLINLTKCKQRFILLKKKNKLTQHQKKYLNRLCILNEPIYKAILLKESFLGIYEYKKEIDIKQYLENWLKDAAASGLPAFECLAISFKEKMEYILNWFRCKISSAISEGFNNKIKRLKRMASGYKDIEYFKLKIHQHCGLLSPKLQNAL